MAHSEISPRIPPPQEYLETPLTTPSGSGQLISCGHVMYNTGGYSSSQSLVQCSLGSFDLTKWKSMDLVKHNFAGYWMRVAFVVENKILYLERTLESKLRAAAGGRLGAVYSCQRRQVIHI